MVIRTLDCPVVKRKLFLRKIWETQQSVEFQNFSISQVLRETKIEDSRSAKNAVFAILRPLNIVDLVNFGLKKV